MKKSKFKKYLLIYTIVLLVLALVFLVYIFFTLKTYEANQTGNFLKSSITKLDDNTLQGYLKSANQDENLIDEYKSMIKSKDLVFEKIDENKFEVSLNNRKMFTIETKTIKEVTKLGMFTYQEREVEKIIPELSRGLIYYDVKIPSNYKLYINDALYSDVKTTEEYKDLDFMYYNDSMPKMATYEINNLKEEANIKVLDFLGKEVELKKNKNSYEIDNLYYEKNTYNEAKELLSSEIDIFDIAHTWSLFLTRDLSGKSYGLGTVQKFLIDGTKMNEMAYNWAHSIDITFTSRHTLGNPIFTNEVLNDFRIYGKDAFSCHVYLEKNMLIGGKTPQKDVMDDTFYFVKYNNEWKLMNIKSGGEK